MLLLVLNSFCAMDTEGIVIRIKTPAGDMDSSVDSPSLLGFNDLLVAIKEVMPEATITAFEYEDEVGDRITVRSDEELKAMLSYYYSTVMEQRMNGHLPEPLHIFPRDDFLAAFEGKVATIRNSFTHPVSPPTPQDNPTATLTSFEMLEDSDVLQLITSHRATTCPLDPIPSKFLQSISSELLPYLSSIVNSSLSSGHVPSVFKTARVTPLLKKPTLDPSDVANYRPVSLLPFLSKTLERAVLKQLTSFLHQNNLLDPHQSGFRSGHSTETALLAVTEALATARASRLSSVLILLDLSAAFDTVNHKILLSTLAGMGIAGTALSWFASYLADRTYQVTWKGSASASHPLVTGVPQGSVLGPLLFSLYTRSLGSVINSHGFSYHCYADDTQLFFSFPPSATLVNDKISSCLADISTWMASHHLKLNLNKTELLFFPHKTSLLRELSITVDGTTVTASHSAKSLGVVLDDQLDLKEHIKATSRSCRFLLYNIRRIRPYLTTHSTQLLVQATVTSRLDYCNSLLANLPACAIQPLQMIQNAAARLIYNLPKFSHVTPLLRSLHWLPVAARIRFKALTLAYTAANRTAPIYLQDMTQFYVPARPLRSAAAGRLVTPPTRPKGSQSFSTLAPQWWNELPVPLRTSPSLSIFRRGLKTHLFRLYLE
ncbi:dual specificity mitogen-activated protein kinase kinase 5 isoform X2 [Anguilla rostrata]|uniref:dual specificity mitogen-activated protein kinase kinase 5 isoform X2 n=1 Tax=Anguilla rostrata TaxID=7938 RepID=UPI0030CFD1E8